MTDIIIMLCWNIFFHILGLSWIYVITQTIAYYILDSLDSQSIHRTQSELDVNESKTITSSLEGVRNRMTRRGRRRARRNRSAIIERRYRSKTRRRLRNSNRNISNSASRSRSKSSIQS
ncbi:uncharacterized protein LOC118183202 isoform X2 [Stegodyphus dumicola]|uniref:uncharacterized protein LOC118183202 isoform X2 n=1 Tax=Stegodyphus dumicola TaxID=202533 RepID=UPI0015A8B506|nr:uncharacterized protein LOC118183202 isoform X2 [Stegodyphus dumicola]